MCLCSIQETLSFVFCPGPGVQDPRGWEHPLWGELAYETEKCRNRKIILLSTFRDKPDGMIVSKSFQCVGEGGGKASPDSQDPVLMGKTML